MGVCLTDCDDDRHDLSMNFWHWRAVVECIRATGRLPNTVVDGLNEPFVGALTRAQAQSVAAALRATVIPSLLDGERILLDGQRTMVPDDGTFHREPDQQYRNYSTNRAMLEAFAAFCESCNGFHVA